MGGLCGNVTLGWLGQDQRDLVNKVEVSRGSVFFYLAKKLTKKKSLALFLIVKTKKTS